MAKRLMKNLGSFVDDLVSDPENPPELTLLRGWLGASSEDKHRRLYLDAELSNSIEIPEDAILRTQELPAAAARWCVRVGESGCGDQAGTQTRAGLRTLHSRSVSRGLS